MYPPPPLLISTEKQISQIREMPQGAAEIETTLIPVSKAQDIVDRLKDRENTEEKVCKTHLWYNDLLPALHWNWSI